MDLDMKQTSALIVYEPTEEFWARWRADKPAMKAQGYTVIKYRNQWYVLKGA